MSGIDINDKNLPGAVYFVVGRGTEGGPASYHLSITGITVGTSDPYWGDIKSVAQSSGHTLGTIQVDLGQRGDWPLGATEKRPLATGEQSYVNAIVEQSSNYAKANNLKFTNDPDGLQTDLLSHGDGRKGRPEITFIDKDTRDSINAWASSDAGKQWIHANMDYAQVKNATDTAVSMVNTYGKNIPEEHRFETVCILAKTANQMPGMLDNYKKVMSDGGNYDDLLKEAKSIKATHHYYGGSFALSVADRYQNEYADPTKQPALDRANAKVSDPNYDPSKESSDPDVKAALGAIGQSTHVRAPAQHAAELLQRGDKGDAVGEIQSELRDLGYKDHKGNPITADRSYGNDTKAAVEAFQKDHGLGIDGVAGPTTQKTLKEQVQAQTDAQSMHPDLAKSYLLSDPAHPANGLYSQVYGKLSELDASLGRTPDQRTANLAGSLTVAAQAQGITRADYLLPDIKEGSLMFVAQNTSPL